MPGQQPPQAKRRGAQVSPDNRFLPVQHVADFEHREYDEELRQENRVLPTEFIADESRSIISENNSPDLGFRYSLNPYRGCEHGCAYCYARPTHEYLGLNAGLDFESKIYVKHRAAALFRDWLNRPNWQPEVVCFSGITDCYQPAERQFQLTRACLQVALEARQPVSIVTKNSLITRDIELLTEMAQRRIVHVNISVTTLDSKLAHEMEPRTSVPTRRLETIHKLSAAGIPVRVMAAPVIPGLNDSEIPAILQAAAKAGATTAAYILLRLPLTVKPVFLDWLARRFPNRQSKVMSQIQATRNGELNDSGFGTRLCGSGEIAGQIQQTFRVFARKHSLDGPLLKLDYSQFHPPRASNGQLRMF